MTKAETVKTSAVKTSADKWVFWRSVARLVGLVVLMTVILWKNASNFDITEGTSILQIGALFAAIEFAVRKVMG